MAPLAKMRDKILQRKGALWAERSSWVTHWQDISTYLLPRSGRFVSTDRNTGGKKHNSIYDNTASRALKIMSAGMMAGATSPARPWFRLNTSDPDLAKYHAVRVWLDDAGKRMQRVFNRSNTYRALHQVYEEIGAFGTASSIVLPSFDTVIHHYPLTVGEYALDTDAQGRVCTLYREFDMTVGALVKEFGQDSVSKGVAAMFKAGNLGAWVTVIHAIEPRADRDIAKADSQNMPWSSVFLELGSNDGGVLRESGFRQFPALCPRWSVTGGDVYGSGPGMESLGDIRQLQHEQLRKAEGIDFQTRPPLQMPTSAKNQDVNTLPGGISFVDAQSPSQGIRPAWEVNLRLDYLLQDIQDVRERIRSSFYADLFLMLANDTRSNVTATEIAERHEEKLLMLGPVMERLHNELLEPMIDMTFARMFEAGALPPPPPELQGMELSIEFVSMLAQAQRAIGTNSVDRFVGNLGVVSQMRPEVLDKFDSDAWVDSYTDMLGVDPTLIVPTAKAEKLREARNRAAAAKEQAAMAQQGAGTIKDLASAQSQAPDMLTQFSGYGSPSGSEV